MKPKNKKYLERVRQSYSENSMWFKFIEFLKRKEKKNEKENQ